MLVDVAGAAGALDRLWLCSSKPDAPGVRSGARAPEAHLVHSVRRRNVDVPLERHAAQLAELGIGVVNMHRSDWTAGLVGLFHRFGVLAFGWDVQEVRHLRELLAMGIDAALLRPRRPHGRDRRRVEDLDEWTRVLYMKPMRPGGQMRRKTRPTMLDSLIGPLARAS